MPLLAAALLLPSALAAPETEVVANAAAGLVAAVPGAGVGLDTTVAPRGPFQARLDATLFGRVPTDGVAFPAAGYLELELAATLPTGPRSRVGLALTGESLLVSEQEQDCSPFGDGCRWYSDLPLGPGLAVFGWAPGVRWSRRGEGGAGLDLAVSPQLAFSYDVGWPLLRIDLDVLRPSGWVWGLETNRFGAVATVGRRL